MKEIKKILLLVLFIFAVTTIQGQVHSFEVFSVSIGDVETRYENGEFKEYTSWSDDYDTQYKGVIDFDKEKISLNNEGDVVYYLDISSQEMFSDQKINGEQTYIIKYDAIDNENVRCRVTIVVYEKLDLMQLYGKYSDISICYDCVLSGKLNETSDL